MRILVAEKQPALQHTLQRCLQEEGFQVDVASEPQDADARSRSSKYDLIVLSLELGGDNRGLSLLRFWRHIGLGCPILTVSVAGGVTERIHCLNLGADNFLVWPFQLAEFRAHVHALLRRAFRVLNPVVRVRDLEIDTDTRTVWRGGRSIHLTRREYELLLYLAFHRGQVVSRSMLWEYFYGARAENPSNVIDVFIRTLRRKIDMEFDVPLILTRYGEGYLLRAENHPD